MARRLLCLALALCALGLSRQSGSPSFDAAGREAISRSLQASVDRGDLPAIVALVVNPAGEIYKGAFGKLDVKQNVAAAPDAIFRIASMTKPVTSVAAMMLVQGKRLQLDASIDTYLGARPRVLDDVQPGDGARVHEPAHERHHGAAASDAHIGHGVRVLE